MDSKYNLILQTIIGLFLEKHDIVITTKDIDDSVDVFDKYGLDSMNVLEFTIKNSEIFGIHYGQSIKDIESLISCNQLVERIYQITNKQQNLNGE